MQGLPDDSLTAAISSGGYEHFGWGIDRHLLVTLVDGVHANTIATGNWEKQPPKFEPIPRPTQAEDAADESPRGKRTSVADLYLALQTRKGN